MRKFGVPMLAVLGVLTMAAAAEADPVPPFKGNDTGGIISAALAGKADFHALASAHCAQYGKVARFIARNRHYGQYTSFACRWVPAGHTSRPLRVRY